MTTETVDAARRRSIELEAIEHRIETRIRFSLIPDALSQSFRSTFVHPDGRMATI